MARKAHPLIKNVSSTDHKTAEIGASTFAFCYASGQIGFGPEIPSGALPIAKGDDLVKLRDLIEGTCRRAYDGKTLLVPGIPEARNQSRALDALKSYTDWISKSLPKGVETIHSKHRDLRLGAEEPREQHPLDRAEEQDREDRCAGDPRIEDHPFNVGRPGGRSAGDY